MRLGCSAAFAALLLTNSLAFAAPEDITGACIISDAFREPDATLERCVKALKIPDARKADQAKFHTQRGLAFHWALRPIYSIPEFTEALKLDPSLHAARLQRGWAYIQARQHALSYQDFTDVLATDPKNSSALFGLATLYYGSLEHQRAVRLLQQALVIDPHYHHARLQLASHFASFAGEPRRALQEYDLILADGPEALDAVPFWSFPPSPAGYSFLHLVLEDKAEVLLQEARAVEAQAILEPLVKQFPARAHLYTLRGLARHILGNPEIALADARKSLALDPYSLSGRRLSMDVLFGMRRYEEALKFTNMTLSMSSKEPSIYAHALRTRAIILRRGSNMTWPKQTSNRL